MHSREAKLAVAAVAGLLLLSVLACVRPTDAVRPDVATAPVRPTPTPALPAAAEPGQAYVSKVVDGDTIDVLIDGRAETVRYLGIDTPERGQPGYKAATEANRQLLGKGPLTLVADETDRDRYGRLLRYVYREDGAFINREMVAQGWAQPVEYRPDVAHADELRAAAVDAAKNGRGFWSGTSPYDGAMSYGITLAQPHYAGVRASDAPVVQPEADTPLTVFGRTRAGDWLQVRLPDRSGGWLPADFVRVNVPIEEIPITDAPAALAEVTATARPDAPPSAATVEITSIFYDGEEPRTEGDEYAVIENTGDSAVNLAGWRLNAGSDGQDFWFPDFAIAPGQACRVYTNRSDPGACGFSFGRGDQGLWANKGDCGYLFDAAGREVSRYCYE